MLALCLLALPAALLELDGRNFDTELRMTPTALVAFVAPWCAHCRAFGPTLERLGAAFGSGVAIGRASTASGQELFDRFGIETYPSLLFFDARELYPYYASEATPTRYGAARELEDLLAFVEERSGVRRLAAPSAPEPEPQGAAAEPGAGDSHVCSELSAAYSQCLLHRRDRPERCREARHEFMMCMSGRWTVHPDRHAALAAEYAKYS